MSESKDRRTDGRARVLICTYDREPGLTHVCPWLEFDSISSHGLFCTQ